MNTLYEALTAALFHFLWQGAAIAALLSIVLLALRRSSPNSRYLAACIALGLMVILPAVTTVVLYEPEGAAAIPVGAAQPVATATEAGGTPFAVGETPSAAPTGAFEDLPLSMAKLREWAIPLWLLGILLFSLRLVWAYGYVVGMRQNATASDVQTLALAQRLAERMRIARPFGVMLSSLADGPSVIGWWRPVILLPSATLLGLSPWQLEAVLAHELAHIRRRDYLVNLLQSVVEILLFYHPAVWWVSNCVRRERELCCDDLAVAISGDAVGYARALTILERQRLALPQARSAMAATWPTLAAAGGWIGLRVRRLVGLVQDPNRPTFVSGLLALGLALGILAVGVNSSDSVAQEGAQEPREPAVNVNLEPVVEPIEIQLEPIETQLRNLEGELQNLDLDVGRYYAQVVEEGRVLPPGVTLSTGVTFNQDGRRARWLDSVGWGGQFSDVDRVINAARSSELSAAQVAAVESIVESYRSQISSAAARVQSDEASLDALLTAETLDRGAATVRLESLISARGEVDRTAASMALAVRERLTLDEWTRLQSQLGNGIALYMRTNTAAPGGGGRGGFGAADGAGAGGSGRGGRRGGPPPTAPEGALPTAAPPPTGAVPTPQ